MKKQLTLYLVLSLLAGLLVTACAGVATGVGPMTLHQPIVGPAVVGLEAPALDLAPLANSMLSRHLAMEKATQTQLQTEWALEHGGCSRGGHDDLGMYNGDLSIAQQSNP
jgi:hypothetical protein